MVETAPYHHAQDSMASGQGMDLLDFVYGDGKQDFVRNVVTPDDLEKFKKNCTAMCRGIHHLYRLIDEIRNGNRLVDIKMRLEFAISCIQMVLAGIIADVLMFGMSGRRIGIGMRRDDEDDALYNLRCTEMLLTCAMDAIDEMTRHHAEIVHDICDQESIPLKIDSEKRAIEVNRVALYWDYRVAAPMQARSTNPSSQQEPL